MLKEIDSLYSKLKSIRPLSPESVRRLSEDFMIDYTYNSNAIEGSTLTLDETALVLKEGRAMMYGKPETILTPELIKKIYGVTVELQKMQATWGDVPVFVPCFE